MDCIFCKIIVNEIPSNKIYEDDDVLAFLDIRPTAKGHTLVAPKKHTPNLLETNDAALAMLISKVKMLAPKIMEALGAAGFHFTINTGSAAGQTVFHLHGHIIPRYENDGLRTWPHQEQEPKTAQELAEHIKKFFQ